MEFLLYFGDVFTPFNFMLLLIGTIGGLILGATPGLSPTMAVALLIPFTFRLEPAQGLILLGAAYTSTVAGGAVSAILLKIPGAPANIATTLDGHTMAQKGEGARALQLSFLASAVGGVFGVLLLIFLTPVLAQWALAFGPSHLFWLAILGVTVIGSLDSGSVVKGLLSGCIGLWLATIGFDDIMGAQRFIFHSSVAGGINVIPALIGLFAIPQVITMFAKGRRRLDAEVLTVERHPIGDAFREIFRRFRALSIGTITGSIIGLIPGVGGQIAGLVAYDQSKKLSPERDKFGTGHSEGVIAAESANNAMVGPSLVPLLTLSIPGSPTAAVLLGGLLIHGIFPGSDLFDNYPDVAWTFINSMLVGQILMCIFGLYIAGLAARVAQAPNNVMAAVVLGLAVFGSYSVQHSMGDVYVMAALGVGMYFLERFGFSAAPLVLGLILGPIAEANFIQGSMIANATSSIGQYFFTGVLNLTLIAIVVLSVLYSIRMEYRKPPPHRQGQPRPEKGGVGMADLPRGQHIIASGMVAAVGISVAYVSYTQEPVGAFLFPRLIATVFAALAIWTFGKALLGMTKSGAGLSAQEMKHILPGLVVALVFVFWAANALGFYTATAFTFFILVSLYDPASHGALKSWIKRLFITAGFLVVMYGLFAKLLNVFTPREILFWTARAA